MSRRGGRPRVPGRADATAGRARAFIHPLYVREDTTILAEALLHLETDPDDIDPLRLIDGLRQALGSEGT